jgi:hypothetical protein
MTLGKENLSKSMLSKDVDLLERSVNLYKESAHANDSALEQPGNDDLALQNQVIVNY